MSAGGHASEDARAFHDACRKIAKDLEASLAKQVIPDLIYHYTDWSGLKGILESGELWLTDIYSLNDPSELRHGADRGLGLIRDFLKKRGGFDEMVGEAAAISITSEFEKLAHYFVCSLSRTINDIGQWRAYADDAQGYAIAFDAQALIKRFEAVQLDGGAPRAFSVLYDDAHINEVQNTLLKTLEPLMPLITTDTPTRAQLSRASEIISSLATNMLRTALTFKHEAYKGEQEFRLLRLYAGTTKVEAELRSRPYSLARYQKFSWKADGEKALKGIIVGPAADSRVATRFAEDCLRAYVPDKVEVTTSDIPYRRTRS